MRNELFGIVSAINDAELPSDFSALFGELWSDRESVFVTQETYVMDFKDKIASEFSRGYGAGFCRLAIAFFNTYGGIIVVGVKDDDFSVCGVSEKFDIESFNAYLTELTRHKIECVLKEYLAGGTGKKIAVVLVPRRRSIPPVSVDKDFDKFKAGTLWIRDRHSVKEADEDDYRILFSDRQDYSPASPSGQVLTVHESIPPSPATMQEFIGRKELMRELWDWFVFGNKPRLYLDGPGGAGKSTLAWEFSKQVSQRGGRVRFPRGDNVDFVIYISGKETELNPLSGNIQQFSLRQFNDADSQFRAIIVDSGMMNREEANDLDQTGITIALEELFANYSGLIVIDDVDALSRQGKDTGEEALFLISVASKKQTKILYTLRFPPPSALASSKKVPELEKYTEFPAFLEACSRQFSVPCPMGRERKLIEEQTSRLPLLTETLIGLRKFSGNYLNAVEEFKTRGGDEARRYLYQREYDNLTNDGNAREVLAVLMLIEEAIPFSAIDGLINTKNSKVRESISECGSIFLNTVENGKGETLYQLAPPARSYIKNVSSGLKRFAVLERRVLSFREGTDSAEELALIMQLRKKIRQKNYEEITKIYEGRHRTDPSTSNPKVQSLVGQAYANLGPDCRQKARECFVAADKLNHYDIFMARTWYFLETSSEDGNGRAAELCEKILARPKLDTRDKAEFKSKLGSCFMEEARRLRSVSPEKTIHALTKSIEAFLSSLWVGRNVRELDNDQALRWLSEPAFSLIDFLHMDIAPYLTLLESLTDRKHDVHIDGASILIQAMKRSAIWRSAESTQKISSLMRKAQIKIERYVSESSKYPGLMYLARQLADSQQALLNRRL